MDKWVLVTGATSGIGRATAEAFAKAGYNVAICARNQEKLEMVREGLHMYHVDCDAFVLDVRDKDMVKREVTALMERIERLDILVNNAGLARGLESYDENDYDEITEVFDTNIKGLAYVTRTILPYMKEINEGQIINVGSTAGIYAYEHGAVYCASKAAVKTLSDGIRIDVLRTNIKVATIQPGIVETPFSEVRFRGDKERAASVYQGIEALQPEDIADIILYVASQPRRVQISDVTVMANQQATGFTIARKEK